MERGWEGQGSPGSLGCLGLCFEPAECILENHGSNVCDDTNLPWNLKRTSINIHLPVEKRNYLVSSISLLEIGI